PRRSDKGSLCLAGAAIAFHSCGAAGDPCPTALGSTSSAADLGRSRGPATGAGCGSPRPPHVGLPQSGSGNESAAASPCLEPAALPGRPSPSAGPPAFSALP